MVNMAEPYMRPNYSLQTLKAELDRRHPGRTADLGFVTGYKSPGNFTGHNADSNGICHAMDIGTQSYNGQAQAITAEQGRDLARYLCNLGKSGFGPLQYGYLIHDMGETDQRPMIAGAFNGWEWQTYNGAAAHSDHIHVSTIDLYWGDPVGIPASVYDSTQPWGIANGTITKPAGNGIQIIKEPVLELLAMPTNQQKLDLIYYRADRYLDMKLSDIAKKVWATTILRGKKRISAIQELADAKSNTEPILRADKEISVRQEIADAKTQSLKNADAIKALGDKLDLVLTKLGDTK